MTLPDTTIIAARISFASRAFRVPLMLSSGPITEITEATAEVQVRVGGREAVGRGSIYLGDLWAWPDPQYPHLQRDAAMRDACETIAAGLPALCGGAAAHPLELGMRLHCAIVSSSSEWEADFSIRMPPLARAVCLSPFDAALHDAVGLALGVSAFALYDEPAALPLTDTWFPAQGAVAAIAATLQPPRPALTAWMVVGVTDDPQAELAFWIGERGYHAFKLKLSGQENSVDVARTIEVYRAAKARRS